MPSQTVPVTLMVMCTGYGHATRAPVTFPIRASVSSSICGRNVDKDALKKGMEELFTTFDPQIAQHPENRLCSSCGAPAIGCQHSLCPRLYSSAYLVLDLVIALCPKFGCRVHGNSFTNIVRSQLKNTDPDITAALANECMFVSQPLAPLSKQASLTVFVVDQPEIPTIKLVDFVPTELCHPNVDPEIKMPYVAETTKRIRKRLEEMKLLWKCVGCGQGAKSCIGLLGIGFDAPTEQKGGFYLAVAHCARKGCMGKAEKVCTEINVHQQGYDDEKPVILQGNVKRVLETCSFCGQANDIKLCAGCKAVGYCSKECQKSDWKKEHKSKCQLAKQLLKTGYYWPKDSK